MELVVSFGLKYCSMNREYFDEVHNLLKYKNPEHDKRLRQLNGLHPEVQAEVLSTPGIEDLIREIVARDSRIVGICCHAGRHRSVAVAEEIGRRTGAKVWHANEKDWPDATVS